MVHHRPAQPQTFIEPLERRSLLSAAPPASAAEAVDTTPLRLVAEQLIGSDPRNQTGVILTFSEALDPASATNLKNYRIGKRTNQSIKYSDDDPDRYQHDSKDQIRFASAVYDPANFTVTLTAVKPFNITGRFRTIRVLSRDELAVRDVAGNKLDGQGDGKFKDAIEKFTFTRGTRISYGELDADRVTLRLTGPGRIWVLRKTDGGRVLHRGNALRVYLDRTDPARSILTGKVVDQGPGDGIAVIQELVNSSTAQVEIASDPSFQIVRSLP